MGFFSFIKKKKTGVTSEQRLNDLEQRILNMDEKILSLKAAFRDDDNALMPEPAGLSDRYAFPSQAHAVFVCHAPDLWPLLRPAFNAFTACPETRCSIVVIPDNPQKDTPLPYEEVYDFFKKFPCDVIHGYNETTKIWVDLRAINMDYLFFQTTYAENKLWKSHFAINKEGLTIKVPY